VLGCVDDSGREEGHNLHKWDDKHSCLSAKDPVFSLTRKKFDAYGELTALVHMEQREWWNRLFHSTM
jgi:hypothetical protein